MADRCVEVAIKTGAITASEGRVWLETFRRSPGAALEACAHRIPVNAERPTQLQLLRATVPGFDPCPLSRAAAPPRPAAND
jgi:hypothetical protein